MGVMPVDQKAVRQILLEAWSRQIPDVAPNLQAIQMAHAMVLHETGAGTYKPFNNGSNNWGAVQACKPNPDGVTCPCKGFVAGDSRPNPDGTSTKYAICFKSYDTPIEGAMDVLKLLGPEKRPKVFAAMMAGDSEAFSRELYGYYEGFGATKEERVAGHVKAMKRNLDQVVAGMGEPLVCVPGGSPERSLDGSFVALGAPSPLAWGAKLIMLASAAFLAFQGGKILGEKV